MMTNETLQGVSILLLIIGGSGLSLYFFQKNKISSAVFTIIFLGFLLRVFCSLDPYLHEWDERFHALVAKNMIENPWKPTLYETPLLDYDFKEWRANHIWLHKQPVPLWTMALSMKLFGVNELAVRLPSVIFSTLCIWFTFLIGQKIFNSRIGFWAAFFLAINGLVIEITAGRVTTDHIDLFFMFFIELGILLSIIYREKKKGYLLFLIGGLIGAAILCKWLPALIVIPFFFIFNFEKDKIWSLFGKSGLIFLTSIAVALPWQLYTSQQFSEEFWWEQQFNFLHFTEGLDGFGKPWWYFVDMARMVWNELIYLAFVWFLWLVFQKRSDQKLLSILVWIILPYTFFSLAATKMQGYVLFVAPAIFIVLGIFIEKLITVYQTKNGFLKYGSSILFFVIILLGIRYGIERVKPFELFQSQNWVERLEKLENKITKDTQKIIVVNEPKYVETMFKYDCIAYRIIPSEEQLQEWKNDGFTIFIRENEDYRNFNNFEKK